MAVAKVGANDLSGRSKTAGTSITLNVGAAITVASGHDLFIACCVDGTQANNTITVSNGGTAAIGSATVESQVDENAAAATGHVWLIRVPITGTGTISSPVVNYATSVTARAAYGAVFSGVGAKINSATLSGSVTGMNLGTVSNLAVAAGSFIIAAAGVEGVDTDFGTTITATSNLDLPETPWTNHLGTTGAGAATNQSAFLNWRLAQSSAISAGTFRNWQMTMVNARNYGSGTAWYAPALSASLAVTARTNRNFLLRR